MVLSHMPSREVYEADDDRIVSIGSGRERADVRYMLRRCKGAADPQHRFLLIHGNPSSLETWLPMMPGLLRHGDVLAYDQIGFGGSGEWRHGGPSLERSADVALALADAIGWRTFHPVGQSHGGMVAIALAARAPERVLRPSVLCTGGTPAHLSYKLLALPGVDRALELAASRLFGPHGSRWLAARLVRLGARTPFSPNQPPEDFLREELQALAARPSLLREMARLTHDDPCAKVAAYANRVRTPTLFIHGESDALVPIRFARDLFNLVRQASPTSRFVTLEGGHMVHYTDPNMVHPLVCDWAKG
jgi:pimeloyl-ACP methyl ester carboxylesterase